MKTYHFKQTQIVNADIDTVWSFFSSPRNLNKITPPEMNFEIVDMGGTEEMQKGQIIRYKVSPFSLHRVLWTTEIVDVDLKKFFVDSQKVGPFAMWRHEHTFTSIADHVKMTDHVVYSMPFGFIGRLINKLVVQDRVNKIFEYRRKEIESIFPSKV